MPRSPRRLHLADSASRPSDNWRVRACAASMKPGAVIVSNTATPTAAHKGLPL
ncbi:Uncharacterised protein [Bordetella pertussis]|nr:Uncharacterised protein [Bordetella pertussis]CFP09747.1 Uncharacterised protein [Bordetella pertussis]CFU05289.1 Uncharacterised protein [Bordetella pertussis]CPJ28618.1 Uncharacterised protein [Bordetella pertussis]CPJ80611.1 Uncharacterised protein [Bordetella pertussis]